MKNGDKIKITYLPPCKNGGGSPNPYIGMEGVVRNFENGTFELHTGTSVLCCIRGCRYILLSSEETFGELPSDKIISHKLNKVSFGNFFKGWFALGLLLILFSCNLYPEKDGRRYYFDNSCAVWEEYETEELVMVEPPMYEKVTRSRCKWYNTGKDTIWVK